ARGGAAAVLAEGRRPADRCIASPGRRLLIHRQSAVPAGELAIPLYQPRCGAVPSQCRPTSVRQTPGGLAMPTALTSAITTTARTPHRLVLTNPADVQRAVDALADGGVVVHGFANIYAITTRSDADVVQRFNRAHDRPTDWLGSITVPPERLPDLFDWTQLP